MDASLVPYRAPEPRLPQGVSEVLAETCRAAVAGANHAWGGWDRSGLVEAVRTGADGTPTYRIDQLVEEAILAAAEPHGVNVLSEEAGFLDRGSAATLVIDPLDGSANAASGVPLSCFSAALFVDGRPVEALNCWLENGHAVWADTERVESSASIRSSAPGMGVSRRPAPRTSGRRRLCGAAVDMLRPKRHSGGHSAEAFMRVTEAAGRIRILSSTCLEAMLVAEGSIDAFADPGSQTHRFVDLAAALLLVPSAGGAVVDALGQPVEFDVDLSRRWSGVIAASEELAEELVEVIADGAPAGSEVSATPEVNTVPEANTAPEINSAPEFDAAPGANVREGR